MPRKKKILFGAVDIGHRIEVYSSFIQKYYPDKLKPESLVVFLLPKEHYKMEYTYQYHFFGRSALYRWSRSLVNFIFCLFRFDIFHFLSGETLLTRKLRRFELMIYKLLGKKIIMQFVGSDIRSTDYIKWKEKNIEKYLGGEKGLPQPRAWQKKLVRDAEKFADSVLVSTPDLTEIIPSAHYYPVMLDVDKFLEELSGTWAEEKKENEIVILHAPSNIFMKGTRLIHDSLKKISRESRHNIRLVLPAEKMLDNPKIYSVSRYELYKLYKEADIIIDQMLIGWYGLQSVEAVAAGKPIVCFIEEHLKKYLFPGCPIIIADKNNFEARLESCIENIIAGNKPGASGLDWVRKYHSIENNHAELTAAWGV